MSPFKSKSQERFMMANKPEIAKKWKKKYGVKKNLNEKIKKAKTV